MWFRARSDRDFADEIAAHIELETDRLIATGMAPAEARSAAMRAFGNRTAAQERFHESRGLIGLEQLMQDLRYAARAMRRAPGFALVAILCLAVGVSVNTAAFSVINAVMFRDFPGVERQHELLSVQIGVVTENGRRIPENSSFDDWEVLRTGIPAFSGIAAFRNLQLSVGVAGAEPQAVRGALVSNGYFEVLGTHPAAGRFMSARDDARNPGEVAVISHAWWKRTFDARPDVAGTVVTIGTRAFTIIGVAPEGFFGLYPGEVVDPDLGAAELFVPLAAAPFLRGGTAANTPSARVDDRWLQVFGRLGPDATVADAEAQAGAVAAHLAVAFPVERRNAFAVLRPAGDSAPNAAEMITAVLAVMAVPAIILLVACANLANQLLARAIQRSREIAVRLALGATRRRVVRQLLVETALLAVIASSIGVVLARWMLDALRAWVLAIPFRIPIDARVLGFTVGLSVLTALAFGLVPALRATRTDLSSALKDGAPGTGVRRSRLRSALVVAQIAASLAMIAVSNVFVRAAQRPPSAALDAIADRALLVSVDLDLLGFDSVAGRTYQKSVLQRLEHLPGVTAAGMAPFAMFDMLGGHPVAQPGEDPRRAPYYDLAEVSGGWFEATNARPVRGRLFSAAERAARPSVAVVDEEFARREWGAAEALGRTLRIGADSVATVVTVVGVVPMRHEVAFRQPEGVVFIPSRAYNARTFFYVRTNGDAKASIPSVREAARAVDPRVPILWVRTMEDVAAIETAEMTKLASGLVSLGAVALALAALGLFGVLSFIVAQRSYEIGIRVALGARRMDVTWMVLRQALRLGASGVIVGALIALGAVAGLRALIHGLESLDLVVFASMSAIMVLVALVASAIPAGRAASADPMTALRAE